MPKHILGLLILSSFFVLTSVIQYPQINSAQATQEAEDTIPYIYYYSQIANGLIIERADGADSRLLIRGLEAEISRSNISWSASGQWYAYRPAELPLCCKAWYYEDAFIYSPIVIKRTDEQPYTIQSGKIRHDFRNIQAFTWSPSEDVIMLKVLQFGGGYQHPDSPLFKLIFYDFAKNEVLREMLIAGNLGNFSLVDWSDDGQQLVFRSRHYFLNDHEVPPPSDLSWYPEEPEVFLTYHIISIDGKYQHVTFKADNIIDYFDQGNIIYRQDGQIIIENILTQERYTFRDEWHADAVLKVHWDKPRKNAFFVQKYSCVDKDEQGQCIDHISVWWFSKENNQLTQIVNQRNSLLYLGGTDTPNIIDGFYWEARHYWSDNGHYGFLGFDGLLHIFNTETQELMPITAIAMPEQWSWFEDRQQLIISSVADEQYTVYGMDFPNLTINFSLDVDIPYSWGRYFTESPNGQYLGLTGYEWAILDIDNQTTLHYLPHSEGYRASFGNEFYNWHPSAEWVIIGDDLFFSSGGNAPDGITIMSIDGQIRRELTECWLCGNWLPENVVQYLPQGQVTPLVPDPIISLVHLHGVARVAWNPEGNFLASATGAYKTSELFIWDMVTQALIVESVEFECPDNLEWSTDSKYIRCGETLAFDIETEQVLDHLPEGYTENDWKTRPKLDVESLDITLRLDGRDVSPSLIYYDTQRQLLAGSFLNYPSLLYDLATNEVLQYFNRHAWDIEFHPTQPLVAVAGGYEVTIWKIEPK